MRTVAMIGVMVLASYFLPLAGLTGLYLQVGVAVATGIGAYAISALFPIKSNASGYAQQELNISTASVGACIPVIFGTVKVSANAMNYNVENLRSEEITAPGGKGGAPAGSMGNNYFMSYEQLICMGEIDAVEQIYTSPGCESLLSAPVENTGTDYTEFELAHDNIKGGTVRLYWGSNTQTRISAGDPYANTEMNYRNFCWVLMGTQDPVSLAGGYSLGQTKGVTSYAWLVRRMPKDCGSIEVRGSHDPAHLHYKSANPCAVLYECITNKVWGLGVEPGLVDLASFERHSWYYAENNIGLNFMLADFATLKDIVTAVQVHCKCQLVQENGQIKFINLLYDRADLSYCPVISEDECSEFEMQAPTFAGIKNRVVADYTSPHQSWKNATVDVRNDALVFLVGEERTQKINLQMFSDVNVAMGQAQRILREVGVPSASLRCTVNRRLAKLQFGDLVQVRWSAYVEGGKAVVIAFRVANKKEAGSDSEAITLELTEATEYPRQLVNIDESTPSTYGNQTWGKTVDVNDQNQWEGKGGVLQAFERVQAFEVPALLASLFDKTNDYAIILAEKQKYCMSVAHMYSIDGEKYKEFGQSNTQSYSTVLAQDIPVTGAVDRKNAYSLTITDSTKGTALISQYNKVVNAEDDLETLAIKSEDYVVCGDEIMQCGEVVHISGTHYKFKNLMRGCYGTPIQAHEMGDIVWFVPAWKMPLQINQIDYRQKVWLRGYPVNTTTAIAEGTDIYFNNPPQPLLDNDPDKKVSLSTAPFPPEFVKVEIDGIDHHIFLRPRETTVGAGIGTLEMMLNTTVNNIESELYIETWDGTTATLTLMPGMYHADTGIYSGHIYVLPTVRQIRFYSKRNHIWSATRATHDLILT